MFVVGCLRANAERIHNTNNNNGSNSDQEMIGRSCSVLSSQSAAERSSEEVHWPAFDGNNARPLRRFASRQND